MSKPIIHVFFLITVLLSACTAKGTAAPDTPTPSPETEVETLTFYSWPDYMDPQIISDFEQKYNVKVNYVTGSSASEIYDHGKAERGEYDIATISDFVLPGFSRQGLLAPLNKENIPNIKNLDPFFANPQYDPNNRYCLPYQWGSTSIGYNYKITGREITSWGDMFDPRFKGKVTFLDSNREAMGAILLYLGYSPNTSNKDEINQARDFLIKQGDQVFSYKGYDGWQWLDGSDDKDIALAMGYSGAVQRTMIKDPNVRFTIPKEGAIIWVDNLCIPAASKHKELAEKFLNYLYEPEVGAQLSNFILYASPNLASLPFIDKAYRESQIMYPSAEVRDRLFYLVDTGYDTTKLYDDAWAEILAAHGE